MSLKQNSPYAKNRLDQSAVTNKMIVKNNGQHKKDISAPQVSITAGTEALTNFDDLKYREEMLKNALEQSQSIDEAIQK